MASRAERTAVVPWGAVTGAYPDPTAADLAETRAELGVPEAFLLYPAQTWAHKNHERLLEALALLKQRGGTAPPLVCSGYLNDLYPRLAERVGELGLENIVRFVGFVSPPRLRCLYAMATGLISPSRFEGWGLASDRGVLPGRPRRLLLGDRAAGDGRRRRPALRSGRHGGDRRGSWRLWTDAELRASLIERGRRRAAELSFERAAMTFRAHYRRIAGRRLGDQDRGLIASSLGD